MARRVAEAPVVRLEPVNRCIYCGTSKGRLTLEHIFPLSLGGTYELPSASCDRCASIINNQIENPITNQDWGWVREKLKMPTRGKTVRTHVKVGSKTGRKLKIPIDDYPACSFVYNFGTAGLLIGGGKNPKHDLLIFTTDHSGDEHQRCLEKYPDWDGMYSTKVKPDAFARLLAKIAWGWIIGYNGSNWFRESITPIIRGVNSDYASHVGGTLDGYVSGQMKKGPPGFFLRPEGDVAKVICELNFIGHPGWPTYHVILGETDWRKTPDGGGFTFGTGDGPPPPCISIVRNWNIEGGMQMVPARPVVSAEEHVTAEWGPGADAVPFKVTPF